MFDKVKQCIANALGKKTSRKIIVIESDDWGSIRMPSRRAYRALKSQGLGVDDHYNRFDSLATTSDLMELFDVLSGFLDRYGNHPKITANCLMANPDFERIRSEKFNTYHFETISETLKRYPGCEGSLEMWNEGLSAGVFLPQFHGREHLNVAAWMDALQHNEGDARIAFEWGAWGHSVRGEDFRRRSFLAAYDYRSDDGLKNVVGAVSQGLEIFCELFGFRSRTMIAPKFVWSAEIEKAAFELGVVVIQGQRNQLVPVSAEGGFQTRFHYSGQKNSLGQRYVVRNCWFEPSSDLGVDWIESAVSDIALAFAFGTPAVISMHRVNFVGAIDSSNRDRNLKMLKRFLQLVLERWPDVEFCSSDDLLDLLFEVPGQN